MLSNLVYYMYQFLIFMFVFSFFNDNFLVDYLGENILKAIFVLFLLFSWFRILINIKTMNLLIDKTFFIFIGLLTIVFLMQNIVDMSDNIIKPIFSLFSIIAIVLYFSRYPIERLLYFVWISMVISIVICYFNDPMSEYTFRTTGGTGDPNNFATQLLAFIFSAFYLYTRNKSKVFLIVSLFLFLYGIFSAGSKSSFLIFALVLFLVLLVKFKHLFGPKIGLLFFLSLLIVVQIDFSKVQAVSNMLDRAESGSKTAETRFISWKAGQHMVEQNPILGVGLEQFAKHTHQYAEIIISATAPHNSYVKLIAESGIIVFAAFLLFIYTLMVRNFNIFRKHDLFWVYLALLATLFMGMTLGLTYAKFQWLFIAILMHMHHLVAKGKLR